jgi:hypothetical protein
MAGLATVRLIETSYIHNAVLADWIAHEATVSTA